jgi:hypothetical protein
MCAPLLQAVRNHPSDDIEVSNLNTALRTANIIPRGRLFYAAFLGETGVGKSSIINAVFSRKLVSVSGSSSACTAYPTIITYKDGAEDDTRQSDIQVERLSSEEIKDCALEQARQYRAAYPRKDRKERKAQNQGAGEVLQIGLEEGISDDEDDESPAPGSPRKTISPSVARGAKTAKNFFEIIFNPQNSGQSDTLQEDLDYLDIESDTFADLCVERAEILLKKFDICDGLSRPQTMEDAHLFKFREELDKVWPLVKSVRLQTGHALLKNNVCILDLPGKLCSFRTPNPI